MTLRTKRWDPADWMADENDGRLFVAEVLRDGKETAGEIASALDVAARARGMTDLARELGISRESLFELVNPYNDEFDHEALRGLAKRLIANLPADAAE